jgi:pimeloyl-ACP methyl ester carboxylesterase
MAVETSSNGRAGMPYASINGLEMYYEEHGAGKPLVLLHGNLSSIEVDFGAMIPTLARGRRVIGVEQQAHGHTADIDRPLSTRTWAGDTAALLTHLGLTGVDILGYSSGAAVALQLGIEHPELVRKLILVSPAYRADGLHPGVLDGITGLQPEHLAGTPFEASYAKNAPRPQDWPVLIEKIKEMDQEVVEWSAAQVSGMAAPTMLVIGDSDIIQPEHAVEMFRLIGGGVVGDLVGLPASRLAVLPGTTHITVVQRADWLVPMVEEFLAAE